MTDLYPSRNNDHESIVPRQDPVIWGPKNPGVLTTEQLDSYEQDGVLILPGFLEDQVDALVSELARLKEQYAGSPELITEPDSDELRSVFRPHRLSPVYGNIARHPKLLGAVEQLLGGQTYLMQSRINVKPPLKGKSFPWHSDFETWHVEDGMPRMRAVTAWVMLTENHEFNGPLYVIPGSHKRFVSCAGQTGADNYKTSLKQQTLGVPGRKAMEQLLDGTKLKGVYGKPGTVVFHECNIMHGSPDNISADPRSILMYVYNSVENACVAPFGGTDPRPDYLCERDVTPLEL